MVINILFMLFFLQLSSVQTYLGRLLTRSISAKIGYDITIKKVDIDWLDIIKLEDVNIKDIASNEMITIKEVMINYRFASLFDDYGIFIDQIKLHNPVLNLQLNDSTTLNITSFVAALKKAYSSKKGKSNNLLIIHQIKIENGYFLYNNTSRPYLPNRFDYNHFGLDSIELTASNLMVIADTFRLHIEHLSSIETSTQLPIKSLSTHYEISNTHMVFDKLDLKLGNSIIKDSIVLNYTKMTDLNHFVTNVYINAYVDKIKLSSHDLAYFAPYFAHINDTIYFKGAVKGYIKNFNVNRFKLQFGTQSSLEGDAYFEGLPDALNTFIDLKIKKSKLHKPDLSIYIPAKSFQKYYPIDAAQVTGTFTGYPKDFVARASFTTSIGFAQTDLNLKIDEDPRKSKYSGSIKLKSFDLGKVLGASPFVGRATLTSKIKGRGFTQSSANFNLESTIDSVVFNGYKYTNISTNAHFSEELFDGTLTINDPNIIFNTTGVIDFRQNRNTIKLTGALENARLDILNIRADSSTLSAKFNANVKGITLDSIIGIIEFTELKATNKGHSYQVNNLYLRSEINNNKRLIELYSDRVKATMEGNFKPTVAFKDLASIWKQHLIKFRNNSIEIADYYKQLDIQPHNSTINFEIELQNINPLLNLFDPLIYLSKNTKISANLITGKQQNLSFLFNNDTIIYNHNLLIGNYISINSELSTAERTQLINLKINSNTQKLRSGATLDSLVISAILDHDSIDFNIHIQQNLKQNVHQVNGLIAFKHDTTLLTIKKSQIQVLNQSWHINKNNLITFTKNNVHLSDMSINSGTQSIYAAGDISKSTDAPILIKIENVDMNNFDPLLTNKLGGIINGNAIISKLFTTPLIETAFKIDSFRVDGYHFGNIEGISDWNQNKEHFDVNFYIEKGQSKRINIMGSYNPLGNFNALNLNADLINLDLNLVEPFTSLFTNISGNVSGNIKIKGALFEPKLSGYGRINNANLTIDYLNSKLNAEGQWRLDSNVIELNNILIADNNSGNGVLNATFSHQNYNAFTMNLEARFEKLKVLNTLAKDNDYFYGTAIGTGSVTINGPFSNLVITTKAKTEKGTKFYIPLSNSKTGVNTEDFISFTNFTSVNDKAAIKVAEVVDVAEKVQLKNVTVNLDLEITPEAYAEIIFDLTAGDIIRGNGTGNLSLGIDTKGKFTMLGDYEFTEGAYNFTMYNIVNKEFKIKPKSNIIWSGDPYLAKMKIAAFYEINTSLAPIIDTLYHDLPEVKRIYPSKVLLDLNGPLLSPEIGFDIIIEDYPRSNVNIDTEVQAFLNRIHNDEQEMNRQVFSLLVFRNFSPPNSFSAGGTLGSSVSEFMSNQLSYWISQVDDNLTIDLDLNDLDENALKTFQLRVSYAFMDGKLIITRDGGFTNQNQKATLASITGDWVVEYLLSQDGKLRVKLFKRTNYDQLSSSTGRDDELISGGFSLLFTTSFDSLKDIFNKSKSEQPDRKNTNFKKNEALKPEDEVNIP